jgi:hypothetical protein
MEQWYVVLRANYALAKVHAVAKVHAPAKVHALDGALCYNKILMPTITKEQPGRLGKGKCPGGRVRASE